MIDFFKKAVPASEYIKTGRFRFYAELNDFLRKEHRQKQFEFSFKGNMTVKDAIESLGVPHTSVDLILVNSQPVGFGHKLKQGDYISVYPEFEVFDISEVSKNGKRPLRKTRFVLDAHLGKLTRKLRLLGFDSVYRNDITDEEIIFIANSEKRIILTRDKGILKSGKVSHGYFIRATHPDDQLKEIIDKFDLRSQFNPFTRCLVCNSELTEVSLTVIRDEINSATATIFKDFYQCTGCKRVYWEGSHFDRMMGFIKEIQES